MKFVVERADSHSGARSGVIETSHGSSDTPLFMPVATRATVKGLTAEQIRQCGADMLLVNLFHLWLRPGEKVIKALGGTARFMGWAGPTLADSGGYQIYSLGEGTVVREEGASFRSPYDGEKVFLSPEEVVRISIDLDVDVTMVLDHLVAPLWSPEIVREAFLRTLRWARRSLDVSNGDRGLFGIVQGGLDPESRAFCASQLNDMEGNDGQRFSGFGIGGLGIGESFEDRNAILDVTLPCLDADKPRYLMGIGYPEDIISAVLRGIDMFDCVLPTRNGRNGTAFTWSGPLAIRNACHAPDESPLDPECGCAACRSCSRAYIHHLFRNKEMLGPVLITLHNVSFYQDLMRVIRDQIRSGTYREWANDRLVSFSKARGGTT